ncbi:MAG: family 10 glycosylhydrolase [Candidatus Cloacimonetes bacterium]|nr:family 10 glycosylhydrolase [Candidatus Cloacimonadota bacterium]
MRYKIICFLLLMQVIILAGRTKALWVPAWELADAENIDELIREADKNGIDQILAEVRYRGDALYFPNKSDATFPNPEQRSYLLKNNPEFDPLAYLIEKTAGKKIQIHAWLTIFVTTLHDQAKMDSSNVYYRHPEWVTRDYNRVIMPHNSYEGAYLDPGLPQVHLYLLNIILDIVKNYPVDGIHLDYIRYPDTQFGYNETARNIYSFDVMFEDSRSWQYWKEEQVTSFVKKVSISLKNISPETNLSAAVFPSIETARMKYSQNWMRWLKEDYVDTIYLMTYTINNGDFRSILEKISSQELNDRIITGLRAWHTGEGYAAEKINDKIKISRELKFAGISLFSYTGIKQNDYFKELHIK